MKGMIIHINGWPGVGKKTVGEVLANRLKARFIHNHVLHDVALTCAGYKDAEYWPLYEKVRSAAYEALLKRPKDEVFVMTNALCKTDDREIKAWSHVVDLAIKRNVPLVPIVLTASYEVIAKRIVSPTRHSIKLTEVEPLREMMQIHALQYPAVEETRKCAVDNLSPHEAAIELESYISSISNSVGSATERHLAYE